jgi:hypothetical protein
MEVVYVAVGHQHVQLATVSARSVKRHAPGLPISIYSDQVVSDKVFDRTLPLPYSMESDHSRLARINKAQAILAAASDVVLYLDCDTYVLSNISNLAAAATAGYEMALAHDTWRHDEIYQILLRAMDIPIIPSWFPYFNGGVILAKKTARVCSLLQEWGRIVAQQQRIVRDPNDQIALRKLLHDQDLRILVLPPEYNVRFIEPVHLSGAVYLLHGDANENLEFLADFLNSTHDNRVYTPHDGRMVTFSPSGTKEFFLRDHIVGSSSPGVLIGAARWWPHWMKVRTKQLASHVPPRWRPRLRQLGAAIGYRERR